MMRTTKRRVEEPAERRAEERSMFEGTMDEMINDGASSDVAAVGPNEGCGCACIREWLRVELRMPITIVLPLVPITMVPKMKVQTPD
eukprot:7282133-Prymnesium_polylepis.1